MRTLFFCAFLGIASLYAVPASAAHTTFQTALTERQKIDLLIKHVAEMKGAKFIRNGSEYSPAQAAEHLQLKLSKAGKKIKTAVDFIEICASESSMSGKKYMIRTADGKERPSRDVLMDRLRVIEKGKG